MPVNGRILRLTNTVATGAAVERITMLHLDRSKHAGSRQRLSVKHMVSLQMLDMVREPSTV